MIGGGEQLFQDVLDTVEYWVPAEAYGHERQFQSELQEFLDTELNSGNELLAPDSGDRVVSTEHGKSRADVVVDDTVGIELKRELSNSQTKKLRGQIEDYLDNYPYAIVCACGIEDMDGWRKLKNKYEGQVGVPMEGGMVAFVHKQQSNYGKDPGSLHNGGGLFGGGGLF